MQIKLREYDFMKAYALIEENKKKLRWAKLGLYGDWWHTEFVVGENGEYVHEIWKPNFKPKGELIRSTWATPTLQLYFKNGQDLQIECF